MNSFSFAGSGSDLLDESSGWMDGCIPLCLPNSVMVIHMIRLVPRIQYTIVLAYLFTGVTLAPELYERVEWGISILQSAKY